MTASAYLLVLKRHKFLASHQNVEIPNKCSPIRCGQWGMGWRNKFWGCPEGAIPTRQERQQPSHPHPLPKVQNYTIKVILPYWTCLSVFSVGPWMSLKNT